MIQEVIIYYIYIFFIGLCVGSFVNVILFRLDRKEGILTGRSECPNCLKRLRWYDLIPLLSYLKLKGKCRYCKKDISYVYPLTEMVTASLFTLYLGANGFDPSLSLWFYLLVIVMFIALAFFDALYLILPDKIVLPLIIAALVFDLIFKKSELSSFVLSGFLFSLFFGIIYLVSRGQWMGFGDVKLVFAIGLILGYPSGFFAIISAVWVAAFWGLALMALKKANPKTALPFGSFLAGSTIIFIIFKDVIIKKINVYQYFF